ncbi:hypothetical protein NM208_g366 [Fusarium decemcellulare]|uniref:Uncharacterized protein n=1 Tax=Fusarium decemcellulare TaxID=57161 RepID=A0ACC1SZV9_9HYPO|nr:hypothetical protein NM208_g366 [Fusarium decemcellulare]
MASRLIFAVLGLSALGAVQAGPLSTPTASTTSAATATPAPMTWEEENRDGQIVFSIDFEDGSFDNWGINDNIGMAYDIRDITTPFGQTKVFKILEPAEVGYGFIDNSQTFQLEQSPYGYKVGFTAKCSLVPQFGSTDWSPVTILLWNNGEKVFQTHPVSGKALGNGWVQFKEEFENGDVTGDTTFSIGIETKGYGLDWYFDNISVSKIE